MKPWSRAWAEVRGGKPCAIFILRYVPSQLGLWGFPRAGFSPPASVLGVAFALCPGAGARRGLARPSGTGCPWLSLEVAVTLPSTSFLIRGNRQSGGASLWGSHAPLPPVSLGLTKGGGKALVQSPRLPISHWPLRVLTECISPPRGPGDWAKP